MKANELRIGNYLSGRNTVQVTEILMDGLVRIEDSNSKFYVTGDNPCLEPIPLTEEWLLKFGFSYDERFDSFVKEYHNKMFNSKDEFIVRKDLVVCDMDYSPETKHVHQLQNLYFALTGEELTIKD